MSYRCKLCGRHKFSKPTPHRCRMGFLKHYNRAARIRGMDTIWELTDDNTRTV